MPLVVNMKDAFVHKMSLRRKKGVFLIGVVCSLFFLQIHIQNSLFRYQSDQEESFLYLPSGAYLKPIALGYDQVLADLLWIKTVSYFGGHYMTDQNYPWLHQMLNVIIDLDPRFDFPYYFGGIVLSLEASQIENANKILERGIQAYPEKWEYPFYIGFNHYYHEGNAETALPYLERASALPSAPDFIRSMMGTLYTKTKSKDMALRFFREAYQNTKDENIRQKIAEKIEALLAEESKNAESD